MNPRHFLQRGGRHEGSLHCAPGVVINLGTQECLSDGHWLEGLVPLMGHRYREHRHTAFNTLVDRQPGEGFGCPKATIKKQSQDQWPTPVQPAKQKLSKGAAQGPQAEVSGLGVWVWWARLCKGCGSGLQGELT